MNFTYNYGHMWREASGRDGGTVKVEGLSGADAESVFADSLAAVESRRAFFESIAPSNGWGTVPDFVRRLRACLSACREHPDWAWMAYR